MADPSAGPLTISEVARVSGRAASSIRYYGHIGLILAPGQVSGRRVLEAQAVGGAVL